MTDRRHPLPWSIQNGWVSLQGHSRYRDDEDRPYRLSLGRHNTTEASLTADELRQLRDRIDAVLAAPFRVLVPNPNEHDEPWLASAIRERLDKLHAAHPHFEIAILYDDTADGPIVDWVFDAHVQLLFYPTVAEMYADGGSRVLLVAGENALELSRLAHEANVAVDLIRRPEVAS